MIANAKYINNKTGKLVIVTATYVRLGVNTVLAHATRNGEKFGGGFISSVDKFNANYTEEVGGWESTGETLDEIIARDKANKR